MAMQEITKIGKRGTVVIPAALRRPALRSVKAPR